MAVMVLSAFPHAPWSIALHCTIGVSERTRDFLRTMDVFFILTCSGVRQTGIGYNGLGFKRGVRLGEVRVRFA